MNDKKLLALVGGAALGAVAVVLAVKHFKGSSKSADEAVQDISDIIRKAKDTINLLDSAVDSLKSSNL